MYSEHYKQGVPHTPGRTPTTSETLLREIAERPDSPRAEEFARIYRPVLDRYVARSRAGHRPIQDADRDDIVQEALLAVMSALRGFKYDPTRGRFRAYLQRTVRNAVIRFQRQQSESPAPLADASAIMAPEVSADGELAIQVWSMALARVMRTGRFTPNTMAAFRRVALDEAPVTDVAREFKLKPNAVYQLKNRILRAVREELERFGGGGATLEELADAMLAAEREGR